MTSSISRTTLDAEARRLGFDAVGVARVDAIPAAAGRLRDWLAAGHHGTMGWMADTVDRRERPSAMWGEAVSAVMLGASYAPGGDPLAHHGRADRGVVSVYAHGRDYHDPLKSRLKALARWMLAAGGGGVKVFVDTAPLMEKPLAAAAGLGWQGKHTNLVSRAHGSWLFLGAVLTTLDLEPDAPARDLCGSCDACQRVCPTDAFPRPYVLDARRCVAYLTIEHRGPIPHALRPGIGNRVYGCDDCLAVCPWNKFAVAAREVAPEAVHAPPLDELLALDDAAFRARFAGTPVKRIGRGRLVRNAAVAAGNGGRAELTPALAALTDDTDPVVAEAAGWALGRISRAVAPEAGFAGTTPDRAPGHP